MASLYENASPLEHAPRKYYSFVEKVESYVADGRQEMIFARFDCIPYGDANRYQTLGGLNEENLNTTPFVHIDGDATTSRWNSPENDHSGTNIQDLEDQWVLLETNTKTPEGIEAFESYNGVAQDVKHSLVRLKPTPAEKTILDGLKGNFSMNNFPVAKAKDVTNVLNQNLAQIEALVVVDVGQGNLNFCADQNSQPKTYFDLGGGTGKNRFTYPVTVDTCRSLTPLVILSHWDMDHIETALRDAANCMMTWLVPNQPVGRTHYTLALRVSTVGRLLVWTNFGTFQGVGYRVSKATGSNKNDSGLVLEVQVRNNWALLPGDAAYGFIPGLGGSQFSWLVASHHGSNTGQNNVPLAHGHQWIAYSYGKGNTYNHPMTQSVANHSTQHWKNRRDTIHGTIVFDTVPLVTSCKNRSCNLSSGQNF